jgi:hypothetical protein
MSIIDLPSIGAINVLNVVVVGPIRTFQMAPAPAAPGLWFKFTMAGVEGDIALQTHRQVQGGAWESTGISADMVTQARAALIAAWSKACP